MTVPQTRQEFAQDAERVVVDPQARAAVKRLWGALGASVEMLGVYLDEVSGDLDPVYGVEVSVGADDKWTVPLGASVIVSSKLGATLVRYRGEVHVLVSRDEEVREVYGLPPTVIEHLLRKFSP